MGVECVCRGSIHSINPHTPSPPPPPPSPPSSPFSEWLVCSLMHAAGTGDQCLLPVPNLFGSPWSVSFFFFFFGGRVSSPRPQPCRRSSTTGVWSCCFVFSAFFWLWACGVCLWSSLLLVAYEFSFIVVKIVPCVLVGFGSWHLSCALICRLHFCQLGSLHWGWID